MKYQTIQIRNMCCQRCIEAVTDELQLLGLKPKSVTLGEATVPELKSAVLDVIADKLKKRGFELIKSKDEEVSEKIKIAIHKVFSGKEHDLSSLNLRAYLEREINQPYKKLADIFSKHNHKTVENYFISHRIEKAKEMIDEGKDSFTEIAFKLGYKSLSHLSRQFKTLERISMHDYKLKHRKTRKEIDKL